MEDPAGEDDPEGMALAVSTVPAVVVGDDYLVTDAGRVRSAAAAREVEASLIKVNQAGTVSAAAAAVRASREAGLGVIVSARSGETEDVTVAHLASGWAPTSSRSAPSHAANAPRSGTSSSASTRPAGPTARGPLRAAPRAT
ncbi:enolase-like domain-containing protein [Tessaracoccus coleopterorum]|uniref:hypothetical protein n=1 Tax=Tessaracoccus coleopterorum TaxID=2714950 RepID=UPI002F90CFB8